MFKRIISIDWSGAASEEDRVNLRVAVWDDSTASCRIRLPVEGATTRSWTRNECRKFLRAALSESCRTLVAMDFGFGLPWGSDTTIFGVKGWRELVRSIAQAYAEAGTARAAAEAINAQSEFEGHGPFRFNEGRTDSRFYLDHGVAYYRLTELAAPQAISQWYLGSGGTVGFHTITGLSAIDSLIGSRDAGELHFRVHPFEAVDSTQHVLVESYPAICPECVADEQCQGDDEHDAWKVLQCLVAANTSGEIESWFDLPNVPFGRVQDVDVEEQIRFEGSIFGLR